jgi:uncharacterized C2H2 Zn-finger protein
MKPIDLSKATDEAIFHEAAVRSGRRGGRPVVLYKCPVCGKEYSASEYRKHYTNKVHAELKERFSYMDRSYRSTELKEK